MDATSREQEIAALLRITRTISDGAPFEEVMHVMVDEAGKRLAFDAFAVLLIDEETEQLAIKSARRISHEFTKRYRRPVAGGVTPRLVFGEQPVLIAEAQAESAECRELRLESEFRSLLCVPLVTGGGGVGYLHFERSGGEPFTPDDMGFAQLLANLGALAREMAGLREQNEQLRFTDPVTGALKYNTFLRALRRELERAAIHAASTAVGLLDIDNFKPYSEIHGLKAGRQLLAEVAAVIKGHVKGIDLVGRLGLDELIFAVCKAGDRAETEQLFDSIRQAVEAHGRSCSEPHPVATIGGLFVAPGQEVGDFTPIILRLRYALHLARNKGGNHVLFVEA
jgi:diguanylate cyclase (GGDEF)-like protein